MKKILGLILLLCFSCTTNEDYSRIPYRQVYLELYLTSEDKILSGVGSYKIYTKNDYLADYEKTGFGGVIVYNSPFDSYLAYDIACPYEAKSSIIMSVDETGQYLVCPECNSKYFLNYGTPEEGSISTYRLQRYKVSYSSYKIIVTNSN